MHKVRYLDRNLSGKYWPYCLRPENTEHIILNQKILAILSQTGKYWPYYLKPENTGQIISDRKILGFFLDKSGLGYQDFMNYFGEKGVSDVQFKLMCIMIIIFEGGCGSHSRL